MDRNILREFRALQLAIKGADAVKYNRVRDRNISPEIMELNSEQRGWVNIGPRLRGLCNFIGQGLHRRSGRAWLRDIPGHKRAQRQSAQRHTGDYEGHGPGYSEQRGIIVRP